MITGHLGLGSDPPKWVGPGKGSHKIGSVPSPSAPVASLDVLAAAAASATSPTAPQPAQAEDEPSPTTD